MFHKVTFVDASFTIPAEHNSECMNPFSSSLLTFEVDIIINGGAFQGTQIFCNSKFSTRFFTFSLTLEVDITINGGNFDDSPLVGNNFFVNGGQFFEVNGDKIVYTNSGGKKILT